jgi:two-component system, OmpR family, sensor kinase
MTGRRRLVILAVGAYAGILVVVAAGLLLLYRGARTHLDEALGQRLLAVATSAAHLVDGDRIASWSFDPEPDTDLLWLATRLEQIWRENDLAEITLCDRDAVVLVAAAGRLERGELNVFWDLDRAAVTLARAGIPAYTQLYRSGALYQKSAHAPVFDRQGLVTGVVTVEGNADFFGALAALRNGAAVTILAVLLGLGLLGFLLWRNQRALERARATLLQQENLAAMGRMTAGIAHEIRNPLGIIRGAGQHLQRLLQRHGIADETAAFIPEEVDRLDRILAGYLALGSDGSPTLEDLDLAALLRRTARLIEPELAASAVRLELAEPLPAATVHGDPHRLRQILLNLLLNARDAMPTGGAVTIGLRAAGARWQVTVVDTGTGLGDADPEQLFAPFHSRKTQGSGLGLTVSRRLAEQHGGSLTLRSDPGRPGCTATLTLPRQRSRGDHDGQNPAG